MNKLAWIDQLKGVGIVSVVAGHVYLGPLADSIYLWHMPLFFLLSGYLFRPQQDKYEYFWAKAIHLLVPYLAYLTMFELITVIRIAQNESLSYTAKYVLKDLVGGRYLVGWVGVFWFVTCLFITQQLANIVFPRIGLRVLWWINAVLLAAAFISAPYTSQRTVAWNADVVLFALPLFFLGWQYRLHGLAQARQFDWPALAFTLVGIIGVHFGFLQTINLKYAGYGTPGVTLVCCLCTVHLLVRGVQRIPQASVVGKLFSSFGQASVVIMFMQQPINLSLQEFVTKDRTIRMALSVAVPWLLYFLFKRHAATRAFFLGSRPDFLALGRVRHVAA